MADVNPAEISAILKQQLSGFDGGASLQEVGTVLEVGDGIARAYGLTNAQSGELVEFENGQKGIVLNLEEDNVGIVLLAPSTDIKAGISSRCKSQLAENCSLTLRQSVRQRKSFWKKAPERVRAPSRW
jgi:F-type H+-transporting ATPase subunit alpha